MVEVLQKKFGKKFHIAQKKLNAKLNEAHAHTITKMLTGAKGSSYLRSPAREHEASLYLFAARDRVAARDIRKAISNYNTAAKIYDSESKLYTHSLEGSREYEIFQRLHNKYLDAKRQVDRLTKVSEGRWYGLEGGDRAAAIIGAGGISLGLLFLSSNVTGKAIAGISAKSASFLGATLFVIGLIAGFFWIKNR